MKYRLIFSKTGYIKYISHLDTMRMFMRIFKKAKLPVKYSEGFSPHPQISFLSAMPLGQESLCEMIDFTLTEDISNDTIKEKLNNFLPEGIYVSKVFEPVGKVSDIMYAEYQIDFFTSSFCSLSHYLKEFLDQENINIEKTNKKGKTKIVDIKPQINIINTDDFDGGASAIVVMPFGSVQNLNPNVFILELKKYFPFLLEKINIKKIKIFSNDMREFY